MNYFRVGQKVVCVDDSPGKITHTRTVILGNVYVVDGIDIEATDDETYGVYIAGIDLGKYPDPCFSMPVSFNAARFRPVVERKTDISIFTRMLNPNQLERV